MGRKLVFPDWSRGNVNGQIINRPILPDRQIRTRSAEGTVARVGLSQQQENGWNEDAMLTSSSHKPAMPANDACQRAPDEIDLSDEVLAAYVDGELNRAERDAVEVALARNPRSRQRLAAFRQVDARLLAACPALARGKCRPSKFTARHFVACLVRRSSPLLSRRRFRVVRSARR